LNLRPSVCGTDALARLSYSTAKNEERGTMKERRSLFSSSFRVPTSSFLVAEGRRGGWARTPLCGDGMWEAGVEPTSRAWHARTLDQLSYSHENLMSQAGLKPATSCFGDRRSGSAELLARFGFGGSPGTCTQPFCLQGKCAARNTCNPHCPMIWSG
jgi:hypothetical protein